MDTYIATLFDSKLPFDPWIAALTWFALYVVNHRLVRYARMANDAQKLIAFEDASALRRGSEPKHILVQILFAGAVFLIGLLLGPPFVVFFAGGLVIAIIFTLSNNVQSLWAARAMARANAATGCVTLSTSLAFRQLAQRLGASALACLLIGLVAMHLALLGGAWLLGSTALGYLRRARKSVPARR